MPLSETAEIPTPVATGTTDQQMWYKVKGDDGQWYKVQSTTPALAKAKVWQITSKAAVAGKKVTQPSADIGRYVEESKPWPSQKPPVATPLYPSRFIDYLGQNIEGIGRMPQQFADISRKSYQELQQGKPTDFTDPKSYLHGVQAMEQAGLETVGGLVKGIAGMTPPALAYKVSQGEDPAKTTADAALFLALSSGAKGSGAKMPISPELLEWAIKHELKVAEKLNVRAFKPKLEDAGKPVGASVAKAKIWGAARSVAEQARKKVDQATALDIQETARATQAGVKIKLKNLVDSIFDEARTRPAFMGEKKILDDLNLFKKQLSTPYDPKTGNPLPPRQWDNMTPSEVLEMSKGLQKPAGWEGGPPEHIKKVATRLYDSVGNELDRAVPGIGKRRYYTSGLIAAEESAKEIAHRSMIETGKAIMHWLSQPTWQKFLTGVGTMELLRESGIVGKSYLFSAGGAMGIMALAETMTSRTGRAVLHQEAAEILMGLRRPAAARGAAPPTAGTAPPIAPTPQTPTPQGGAPISPVNAPQGPQVAAPQQLTSQTAKAPFVPPPPIPNADGTITATSAVVPPRSQPTPNTPEASAWHNEALQMAREKLPNATLSEQLQEAARIQKAGPPSAGAEAKISAKAKALADAIPELQLKLEKAEAGVKAGSMSGWEYQRAKVNLEAAKKALESGDPKEMQVVKRRLDVARYQRKAQEKKEALAPQQPTPTGATRIAEPASPAASPEQITISIEDGYREIEAMGEVKLHGETINTKLLVKGLRAKFKSAEPQVEQAAVQQVLESLRKGTK